MITLAEIAVLKAEAEDAYRAAYEAVCRIARKAGDDGVHAVALLDTAKRELEVLQKLQVELISNGRVETRQDMPEPQSAAVTPLKDSGAL